MKKTLAYLMVLVVGAAVLPSLGCSKADPRKAAAKRLVGVWTGKQAPQGEGAGKKGDINVDVPITVEFKDGGAMSMSVFIVSLSGTWEVLSAEGNNVSVKTVLDMPAGMESDKGAGSKGGKETQELSIVFQTDDRITMASKDDPKDVATLDRQKK